MLLRINLLAFALAYARVTPVMQHARSKAILMTRSKKRHLIGIYCL